MMQAVAPGEAPTIDRPYLQSELLWLARFESLKTQGYLLRPRYRPGWAPSWDSSEVNVLHEEAIFPRWPNLLDAERVADGKRIFLKCVPSDSPEIEIGRYLSSDELRNDPRNHSVPLLDVLTDVTDPSASILVLPILRRVDQPELASVRECIDFVSQTLEGLAFLHEHHIAHRDCAMGNIMMDGRPMFPKGWHAIRPTRYPDGRYLHRDKADNPSRTASGGVRYYYIDFGISTRDQNMTTGMDGQERSPELSKDVPYDPYKLDVYILGKAYEEFLIGNHTGLDFIRPLIAYMTPIKPRERPSVQEALQRFNEIRADLKPGFLAQRLPSRTPESVLTKLFRDGSYLIKDALWTLRRPHALSPLP